MARKNTQRPSASDIRQLISALGGDAVVVGFWDFRIGLSATGALVDSWADVRGAAAAVTALTAAGVARPTLGLGGLTFDGVGTFLRTVAGLGGITGSCAMAMVARGVSVPDRREWEISVDSTTSILTGSITSGPAWTTSGLAANVLASGSAPTARPRIWHARRTVTVDVATRMGSAAETTAASATAGVTATRLTVGGGRTDVPTLFTGLTDLRAMVLLAGVYSAAQAALITAWAQATHDAVLTS
jgi:hypothetical protein